MWDCYQGHAGHTDAFDKALVTKQRTYLALTLPELVFLTKSPNLLLLLSGLSASCKDEHLYVYEHRGPNAF